MADVPIFPRYPGVAKALAYLLARHVIERQWRARGLRIRRYADIIEQARAYQAEHQEELLAQAAEAVQRDPVLRKMAEREERERERQRRKSKVVDRAVYQTDHAKAVSQACDPRLWARRYAFQLREICSNFPAS
jgi:hypothetical protein